MAHVIAARDYSRTKRFHCWWIEWGYEGPFSHRVDVWLTSRQRERFHRLNQTKSLTEGCEYARRVSKAPR